MTLLIEQADNELDILTRSWQRRQKTVVIAPETQDFNLTTGVTDYQSMHSLINNARTSSTRPMNNTTLSSVYSMRSAYSSGALRNDYAVDRDDGSYYLRLIGDLSADSPADLTMVYRIGIPNYSVADASWMEDEYKHLYINSVFKAAAVFLREDDRIKLYTDLQREALDLTDQDDKHHLQHGGSPLAMQAHHHVP
jgi:hypothetical protein